MYKTTILHCYYTVTQNVVELGLVGSAACCYDFKLVKIFNINIAISKATVGSSIFAEIVSIGNRQDILDLKSIIKWCKIQ